MPEVTAVTPDTPIWADLASPDLEASKTFYGRLFGWEADQVAGPEAGSYTMFKRRGKLVAGMGSIMGEGQPPTWTVYMAAPNADQTAEKIREAGGTLVMGPMDVMQAGRMAIFQDPTGAYLGLWQPGEHKGSEIMREPGSITWVELMTRDIPAAHRFYSQVFGWQPQTSPMGEGGPEYTEWKLGSESIGGAMAMMANIPEQVPPHWKAYFDVENADRSASQVAELGGQVLAGPMDFPGGRFAVVADPHGAVFGVLHGSPQ